MGKASKWFRTLFAGKKPDPTHDPPPKKKWRFSKSRKEKNGDGGQTEAAASDGGGLNYSIAYVSRRGAGYGSWEVRAAVTIQSHFRAYLSRRALRALKALVKLQALVRGIILRKQMANVMRQMEALTRAQARAQASRVLKSKHTGLGMPQRIEQTMNSRSMKPRQHTIPRRSGSKSSGNVFDDAEKSHLSRVDRRSGEGLWDQGHYFMRIVPADDGKYDKILEVDTWKPRTTPRHRHMFHSSDLSHSSDQFCQSFSTSKDSTRQTTLSGEVQSFGPLKPDVDDSTFYTPDSSPQVYLGCSSRRGSGAFTPNKTEGFRSGPSGYSDHPNYMAYTESSRAKARSFSAPKQRPYYEPIYTYGKASAMHANFISKAYPGSGRLDRLGMSVGGDVVTGFSGPWHRY